MQNPDNVLYQVNSCGPDSHGPAQGVLTKESLTLVDCCKIQRGCIEALHALNMGTVRPEDCPQTESTNMTVKQVETIEPVHDGFIVIFPPVDVEVGDTATFALLIITLLHLTMEEIYVRHVELLGFEKRFFPSQHYVYMLMVKWNDLSEKLIYRGYPEIYTFHKSLKEMFPIEAGDINKKDRIIPALPAPKWLDNQKSTETRQSTLAEYCSSVINLPPKISRSQLVRSLFKVRPEDENPPAQHPLKRNETFVVSNDKTRDNTSEISGPIILESYRVIADYSHTSKYEITLHIGDLVEIVEKSPNGWWFCQCDTKRGWVPASYLEPLDGPEESEEADPNYAGELYITTKAYKAAQDDELTLEMGETIEVIHKLLDGWWVVRKGEETGHFPSMFLYRTGEKMDMVSEELVMRRQTPPPRRSTIRNAQSIHSKGRQRISQDTYRRNSRRFLQQKGGRPNQPRKTSKASTQSPLQDWNNRDNMPKTAGSSPGGELKGAPIIPPRPSPELIMERCTENTRKKVSVRKSS
nr:neutrophil cytosolic factor 1-like isoform X2 [Oncorhynchus nerka]